MQGQYATNTPWSQFAATALLVSVPVMLVFFAMQRYLVSGLTLGGVKGERRRAFASIARGVPWRQVQPDHAGAAVAAGGVHVQVPAVANTTQTGQATATHAELGVLRVALVAQIALGLLWGVSMLFFAQAIALGDRSGPHIEKIAMEGGAHFALVFGAVLAWRSPSEARPVVLMMIFLNALWALTDLVYIPLYALTAIDFAVKLVVNLALAIALVVGGRRARLL